MSGHIEQHTAVCSLRLLTGWLKGLTFAEVSSVVNINERDLRKVLHGKAEPHPDQADRIDRLKRLTHNLRLVIPADKIGWWYKTNDPALNGQTPIEALRDGRLADIEQIAASYLDPSYS